MRTGGLLIATSIAFAMASGAAVAQGNAQGSATAAFAGKTLTLLVGGNPGGGYDTYSRTIARHLPKHLPGSPNIVVRNQPGAGSGTAAAAIYRTAPKDGSWIGAIFPGVIMHPIFGAGTPLQFDPKAFRYLASADDSTRVCITRENSGTKTMTHAQKGKTIMGASAAGGSTRDYAVILNNIAGTKFEVVAGYRGTVDIFLAMERGEVDGMCGIDWSSLRSQRPDWVANNQINILVETALEPSSELKARGVPIVWSFVDDKMDREAARLIFSQQVFGRPFIAPPETPDVQVAALRAAFAQVFKDPDYKAEAEKARIAVNPVSGEDVQKLVDDLYNAPSDIVERARKIMTP